MQQHTTEKHDRKYYALYRKGKKKRALQVKDAKEVQARSDRGTRTAGSQGSTRCQSAILPGKQQ
ncbi:MAG: hypothetical protein WBG98_06900, partial [Brucella anthropi]